MQVKYIKNKVVTVSSSSRFNYGDVLYPFLAEKIFDSIEFHINLMGKKKFETNIHFEKFKSKEKYKNVLYLGGEMFPKSIIKHYKSESKFNYILSRLKKKIDSKGGGFFVQGEKIIAIGIGLQNLSEKDISTIKFLKEFDYLGVRDQVSYNNATSLGIKSELINDFAFLTSKVCPILEKKKEKIIFHFNEYTLKKYFHNVVSIIEYYSDFLKCDFDIVNMATCPNHDSKELNERLCRQFGKEFILYDNVESITYLLATSKYYIGNSFHGGVVNLSYGGEIIWVSAHSNKIKNLAKNYAQTYIDILKPDLSKKPSKIEPMAIEKTFEKIYEVSQIF